MKSLLFIPGSLRAASSSRAFARTLAERVADAATVEFADIGRLPHYNADLSEVPEVDEFKARLGAADGLVFVTPEYNYSLPGVLKNAIDWASRPAFKSVFVDKPCFIVTVSGGGLGGVRAQSHLKYVLSGMLARVFVTQEVVVPQANKKVADGTFTDETNLDFAETGLREFIAAL